MFQWDSLYHPGQSASSHTYVAFPPASHVQSTMCMPAPSPLHLLVRSRASRACDTCGRATPVARITFLRADGTPETRHVWAECYAVAAALTEA